MKLDRVTITGPDASIAPEELLPLSVEFPFVEWGILHSASQGGGPRFPSEAWLTRLGQLASDPQRCPTPLQLSLHLCGRWVRDLLRGVTTPQLYIWLPIFQRVQLNFHAEKNPCQPREFFETLCRLNVLERQWIFQLDGALGNAHLEAIYDVADRVNRTVNAVGLFDISGGCGIVPDAWPMPIFKRSDAASDYHGYAGGLGPDNLARELPRIAAAAGPARIWIDMESGVRSNHDQQFDLAKVRRCLEIARPFVTTAG